MAPVDPAGARVNLLFLPAIALALTSLGAGPLGLALGLGGAAIWTGAAWLTREGLRAEQAFHARRVAKRPAMPRKIAGSLLVALGTAIAALAHGADAFEAILYGIVAGALHLGAFGLDPLRDKLAEGVDTFQQDRVARVVDEAQAYLADMRQAIAQLRDRRLDTRIAAFEDRARQMIETVENDPRDLSSARKFLGVYLMGARDASVKFADHYARSRDETARRDYEALLTDLDQNFAARTQKMLAADADEVNVEIEVLRDRLQREGVAARPDPEMPR